MSYEMRMRGILAAFGIGPTQHLPVNGALNDDGSDKTVYVDGVEYWIAPRVPAPPVSGAPHQHRHRKPHRVMCRCPKCGKVMSAGRLPQHLHTMACVRYYWTHR